MAVLPRRLTQTQREPEGPPTVEEQFKRFMEADRDATTEGLPEPIRGPAFRFKRDVTSLQRQAERPDADEEELDRRLEEVRNSFKKDIDPMGFKVDEFQSAMKRETIEGRGQEIEIESGIDREAALDIAIQRTFEELRIPIPPVGVVGLEQAEINKRRLDYLEGLRPGTIAALAQRAEAVEQPLELGPVSLPPIATQAIVGNPAVVAADIFDQALLKPATTGALAAIAQAQRARSEGGVTGAAAAPIAGIGDFINVVRPGFTESGQFLLDRLAANYEKQGAYGLLEVPRENILNRSLSETEFPFGVVGTTEVLIDVIVPLGALKAGPMAVARKSLSAAKISKAAAAKTYRWNADAAAFVDVSKLKKLSPSQIDLMHLKHPGVLVRDIATKTWRPFSNRERSGWANTLNLTQRIGIRNRKALFRKRLAYVVGENGEIKWGDDIRTKAQLEEIKAELAKLPEAERLVEASKAIVKLTESRFGVDEALNLATIAKSVHQHADAVSRQMAEPVNRVYRKVNRFVFEKIDGLMDARFSDAAQTVARTTDAFREGRVMHLSAYDAQLTNKIDNAFNLKSGPWALRKWTIFKDRIERIRMPEKKPTVIKGVRADKTRTTTLLNEKGTVRRALKTVRDPEVDTFFDNVDTLVKSGFWTPTHAAIAIFSEIVENTDNYVLTKAQKEVFDDIKILLRDNQVLEELGFNILPEELVESYMPRFFKSGFNTTKNEYGEKVLSKNQVGKITEIQRDFMKDRSFVNMRGVVEHNVDELKKATSANREPNLFVFSDDIKHPLDPIRLRLADSTEKMSDRFFNNFSEEVRREVPDAIRNPRTPNEFQELRAIMRRGAASAGDANITDVVQATFGNLRSLLLNLDIAFAGVQGWFGSAPDLLLAGQNPGRVVAAAGRAIYAAVNPKYFQRYIADNLDEATKWAHAGLKSGESLLERTGREASAPFIERGSKNPIRFLNQAQFQRAAYILKIEVAKLNRDMLASRKLFSRASGVLGRGSDNLDDLALYQEVARFTNNKFGGGSTFMGNTTRALASVFMLTPTFTKATLDLALRPALGGFNTQSALARSFWTRMLVLQGAIGSLISLTFTGKPMNVTDPSRSDWFVAETDKEGINLLGRFRGPAQLIYASANDIGKALKNELPRQDQGTGPVDVTEIETFGRLTRFWKGRESSPIQTFRAAITERDYLGEPLFDEDEEGFGINLSSLELIARQHTPISVRNILEDREKNRGTVLAGFASALGLSAFPLDLQQERVEDLFKEEVAKYLIARGMPSGTANKAADDAVERRQWARPADIEIEGDDKERILMAVAGRAGLSITDPVSGEVIPDTELAARYGRPETITPREKRAMADAQIDEMFRRREEEDIIYRQQLVDIQNAFFSNEDPAIATFQDFMDALGRAGTQHRARLQYDDALFVDAIERLKQKSSIPPSERDLAFELIRTGLYDAVKADGTIDFRQRKKNLELLEKEMPNFQVFLDDFFTREFDKPGIPEGWKLRQSIIDALTPYYEIPLNLLDDHEYDLWARYEGFGDNKRAQVAYIRELGPRDRRLLMQARRLVDREQQLMLRGRTEYNATEIEVGLYLLYGRMPKRRDARRALSLASDERDFRAGSFDVAELNNLFSE